MSGEMSGGEMSYTPILNERLCVLRRKARLGGAETYALLKQAELFPFAEIDLNEVETQWRSVLMFTITCLLRNDAVRHLQLDATRRRSCNICTLFYNCTSFVQ